MVRKRDGSPEKFDRDKVASGIRKACAKRPVPGPVIEELVQDIEDMVMESPEQEAPSRAIGQMITDRLMDVDEVAYLRWSSVYQDFRDAESFRRAVEDLEKPEGMGTGERPTALAGA
jgi:transcriptional repressor NrdR